MCLSQELATTGNDSGPKALAVGPPRCSSVIQADVEADRRLCSWLPHLVQIHRCACGRIFEYLVDSSVTEVPPALGKWMHFYACRVAVSHGIAAV